MLNIILQNILDYSNIRLKVYITSTYMARSEVSAKDEQLTAV